MERFKKILILLLVITLNLFFLQCTKYKEEVPFFGGLFLEYDVIAPFKYIYKVYALDNNRFKIIKTEKRRALGDKTYEYFVDAHGRVYKTNSKGYKGKFSPIWIPVHEMEIGDTFDGGYTVTRKEKWKGWGVLVVKDPDSNNERYFDINTGYWVGSYERRLTIVLIDTNADIPIAE